MTKKLNIDDVEFYTDKDGNVQVREIVDEPDVYTLCRCKKCKYEENVPDFILSEFADFERFIGKKNVIPELECPECGKVMIPVKYFNN